jgi:hypothetical protein
VVEWVAASVQLPTVTEVVVSVTTVDPVSPSMLVPAGRPIVIVEPDAAFRPPVAEVLNEMVSVTPDAPAVEFDRVMTTLVTNWEPAVVV